MPPLRPRKYQPLAAYLAAPLPEYRRIFVVARSPRDERPSTITGIARSRTGAGYGGSGGGITGGPRRA